MERKRSRPPGCGVQNGRGASRFRRETHKTLARTRANRKCVDRLPRAQARVPHLRGSAAPAETVLEVDVELQEVLPKTKHGKGKPKSSDVERRIREARKSADPWVGIERIRQEQGYARRLG